MLTNGNSQQSFGYKSYEGSLDPDPKGNGKGKDALKPSLSSQKARGKMSHVLEGNYQEEGVLANIFNVIQTLIGNFDGLISTSSWGYYQSNEYGAQSIVVEQVEVGVVQIGPYQFVNKDAIDSDYDDIGEENQSIVEQMNSEAWHVNNLTSQEGGQSDVSKPDPNRYLTKGYSVGQLALSREEEGGRGQPSWLVEEQTAAISSHYRVKELFQKCKEFEGVMLKKKNSKANAEYKSAIDGLGKGTLSYDDFLELTSKIKEEPCSRVETDNLSVNSASKSTPKEGQLKRRLLNVRGSIIGGLSMTSFVLGGNTASNVSIDNISAEEEASKGLGDTETSRQKDQEKEKEKELGEGKGKETEVENDRFKNRLSSAFTTHGSSTVTLSRTDVPFSNESVSSSNGSSVITTTNTNPNPNPNATSDPDASLLASMFPGVGENGEARGHRRGKTLPIDLEGVGQRDSELTRNSFMKHRAEVEAGPGASLLGLTPTTAKGSIVRNIVRNLVSHKSWIGTGAVDSDEASQSKKLNLDSVIENNEQDDEEMIPVMGHNGKQRKRRSRTHAVGDCEDEGEVVSSGPSSESANSTTGRATEMSSGAGFGSTTSRKRPTSQRSMRSMMRGFPKTNINTHTHIDNNSVSTATNTNMSNPLSADDGRGVHSGQACRSSSADIDHPNYPGNEGSPAASGGQSSVYGEPGSLFFNRPLNYQPLPRSTSNFSSSSGRSKAVKRFTSIFSFPGGGVDIPPDSTGNSSPDVANRLFSQEANGRQQRLDLLQQHHGHHQWSGQGQECGHGHGQGQGHGGFMFDTSTPSTPPYMISSGGSHQSPPGQSDRSGGRPLPAWERAGSLSPTHASLPMMSPTTVDSTAMEDRLARLENLLLTFMKNTNNNGNNNGNIFSSDNNFNFNSHFNSNSNSDPTANPTINQPANDHLLSPATGPSLPDQRLGYSRSGLAGYAVVGTGPKSQERSAAVPTRGREGEGEGGTGSGHKQRGLPASALSSAVTPSSPSTASTTASVFTFDARNASRSGSQYNFGSLPKFPSRSLATTSGRSCIVDYEDIYDNTHALSFGGSPLLQEWNEGGNDVQRHRQELRQTLEQRQGQEQKQERGVVDNWERSIVNEHVEYPSGPMRGSNPRPLPQGGADAKKNKAIAEAEIETGVQRLGTLKETEEGEDMGYEIETETTPGRDIGLVRAGAERTEKSEGVDERRSGIDNAVVRRALAESESPDVYGEVMHLSSEDGVEVYIDHFCPMELRDSPFASGSGDVGEGVSSCMGVCPPVSTPADADADVDADADADADNDDDDDASRDREQSAHYMLDSGSLGAGVAVDEGSDEPTTPTVVKGEINHAKYGVVSKLFSQIDERDNEK